MVATSVTGGPVRDRREQRKRQAVSTPSAQMIGKTSDAWDPTLIWTALPNIPKVPEDIRAAPAKANETTAAHA